MGKIPENIEKMLSSITINEEVQELLEKIFQQTDTSDLETQLCTIKSKITESQKKDLPKCFYDYLGEIINEIRKAITTNIT